MATKTQAAESVVDPTTDNEGHAKTSASNGAYELPLVGVQIPAGLVDIGFWVGLVGAAAVGAIAPPVAVAVGAGAVIARHRSNPSVEPDKK